MPINRSLPRSLFVIFLASVFPLVAACFPKDDNSSVPIRLGVLAFGTLNWEISVIRDAKLDKAHGVAIEPVPLAGADAGKIGLQGGRLDMIVGDWIWVARQRERGMSFVFRPYSTSHGALIVPGDSLIRGVADLKGRRLGIAGGGLDKNWLLLRALARKTDGLDLDRDMEKVFGAPPLLDQQLRQGKLDAVLIYWNYAAKLEAQGYRKILDGRGILQGLGIKADVPALGYIFREDWAKSNAATLAGFFAAADEAKNRICDSDEIWRKVIPLTRETNREIQAALRRQYCAGRVTAFGEAEREAAGEIFGLINGADSGAGLPEGVFWPRFP